MLKVSDVVLRVCPSWVLVGVQVWNLFLLLQLRQQFSCIFWVMIESMHEGLRVSLLTNSVEDLVIPFLLLREPPTWSVNSSCRTYSNRKRGDRSLHSRCRYRLHTLLLFSTKERSTRRCSTKECLPECRTYLLSSSSPR